MFPVRGFVLQCQQQRKCQQQQCQCCWWVVARFREVAHGQAH
nr:MAG TPA: hypothetical protein [Caudoviricetes sp.]